MHVINQFLNESEEFDTLEEQLHHVEQELLEIGSFLIGATDNSEEDELFDDEDYLNESKAKTHMQRVTKLQQIHRAAGRDAMFIARQRKDAQYKRYQILNKKRMELKKKILKKYKMKGLRKARKSMM